MRLVSALPSQSVLCGSGPLRVVPLFGFWLDESACDADVKADLLSRQIKRRALRSGCRR